MKVRIEGLDCPNCARALENEINKIEGVQNAKIDFVKSSLTYESDDINALDKIKSLTKRLEPDARIIHKETSKKVNKKSIIDLILLCVGLIIGVIIFFVKMPTWTFWTLYALSALLMGYNTYYKAMTLLFRGIINENLLVTISVVGASIISEHMEGLMVIALYSIGKVFENIAVNKSRKSIEALAKIQPDFAVILNSDGKEERVKPEEVPLDSIIIVKAGEKVAIDGKIIEGRSSIDMQSLTGESVPVNVKAGDEILSGSIVLDGVIKIKTTSLSSDSTITKIQNLVETAAKNKSKTETFISKLTKWYTLAVVGLALIVWGIVWAVTKNFDTAVYRGLIFLVISCPCAFAISVPLSYFSGLGNASKHGILIKGSNYLDACANLSTIAFDKTGTLTTGQFTIEEIKVLNDKLTQTDILHLCALGEQYSLHPLAKAICEAYKGNLEKISAFKEVAGKGVEFKFKNKKYFVGRKSKDLEGTCVELFENQEKLGEIILSDTIKTSSFSAINDLKEMKVKTVLLSGDNEKIVSKVAKEINIDESFGKLLPEDKYNWINNHKSKTQRIGYVGDGINDAPSLSLADVGFSMGINGSPASIEASDVVLVDDNPEKITSAIKISKFTRKIVIENIAFSAIVKVVFLALGAFGITGMLWAVFADVGVTLLAILNSLRALKYKPKKKNK